METIYGKVHVIVSGPQGAPPVLLFHAGKLPSWSWRFNIEELNQHFRTYAVDAIGEPGKSVLNDTNNHPADGKDVAELYIEITEKLGVDSAYVIGASYGGFIRTN